MNFYSYKVEHDYGLAPNPFGKYCTLAVCKGDIRGSKRLELGDWVFGTGSRSLENTSGENMLHHLIFAMQVEEKITFDEYWNDPRFEYKKPIINGSLVKMYGDNFYHHDSDTNEWVQENSAHSMLDGSCNIVHQQRDTKSEFVLISETFFYFGDSSPLIPERYRAVCCEGRNVKSTAIPTDIANEFITWLNGSYEHGIHGDPVNWVEHLIP
jgi:hypothetical protein